MLINDFEFINKISWGDIVTIFSALVSLGALIAACYIGYIQNKINKRMLAIQENVDVFLSISPQEAMVETEKCTVPIIKVQNIGTFPITLTRYICNGVNRKIAPFRLPPASQFPNAYYYIYLPIDGCDYVSFKLYFKDTVGNQWVAIGYAEFKNDLWEIAHETFEKESQ